MDLVPLILAGAFCININILDTSRTGVFTEHLMSPRDGTTKTAVLQRSGDHDNGVTIIEMYEPLTQISTDQPKDVEMRHDSISLPAPLSLAPLPKNMPSSTTPPD